MKATILTLDDSRTIRNLLLATLNHAGYQVIQAGDGIEGLEILEKSDPSAIVDVIITDINMPRLDGFGFIKRVRQNEHYRHVPILVLTTEDNDEKKNMAHEARATGWIVKPFHKAKLLSAIERVTA